MPASLSIKNVPDETLERLRRRAERNHRSLQGEVMAILESAVRPKVWLTPQEVLERGRAIGLSTPAESVAMIREDRDSR